MRRVALVVELALSVALVASLVVAAWKLHRVLDRLDAGRLTSAAFAVVFAGAAVFAGRRALAVVRRLKRYEDDETSRRR